MTKEMAGRVALITGGGRGFGKAIALRFAAEGAAVAVTSRTQSELDKTVSEIEAAGGRGFAVSGDVTKPEDVKRVVRETTDHFGAISLYVNNAGIPGPFAPTWAADPAEWWFAQEVHLRAFFMFVSEILPSMIARRAGHILAVSAIASYRVDFAMSAYCVGKTAQNRLVQFIASDSREFGVSAFALDPGFVATELAEDTMRDPGAQRWKPEMIEHLKARKTDPNSVLDFDRCAQRCVDLASGRYDELSGSYFELRDNLDEMLRKARDGRLSNIAITSHWRTV
ncbi:MAG TPA: SDR family oxidoreductase [Acidobacteriota bacterium]|nr:SDR family oxidoreductase [Acidobacteriota bacterium]